MLRCTTYSPCRGLRMPCGRCYCHCKCPPCCHDRYIISVGEIRVQAAQAVANATAYTVKVHRKPSR